VSCQHGYYTMKEKISKSLGTFLKPLKTCFSKEWGKIFLLIVLLILLSILEYELWLDFADENLSWIFNSDWHFQVEISHENPARITHMKRPPKCAFCVRTSRALCVRITRLLALPNTLPYPAPLYYAQHQLKTCSWFWL
jgi:hypothetical protein